ncbi:flagellar motor protein MotB [Thioclava sp. 15-R06ZXC-3]|uniref:Flagellar motor protein MotB n=1 Tax=Thioclava arctica TaxID=3238301 RepID=A0ABV3TKX7_9RHOB
MGARDTAAPVIIKRKKVVSGGGHHGGAWKVAYADFVTAMMAFFLLMWLLNATTEKQRKGIADYFNPTIPINRISGGGDGAFGGESVFSEDQIAQTGSGAMQQKPTAEHQAKGQNSAEDKADADKAKFDQAAKNIEKALMGVGGESMVSEQLARHIVTKVTDEGLIVEFFDLPGEPLFIGDSATPEPLTRDLAKMITRVFGLVKNQIAINGYTRSYPQMLKLDPVWELSSARAQSMRELLEAADFDKTRIQRVTGYADRKPSVKKPMDLRNNRLEIILLRNRL